VVSFPPSCFIAGGVSAGTQFIRGRVGSKACLDAMEKEEKIWALLGIEMLRKIIYNYAL
jgi:hypothetical protein